MRNEKCRMRNSEFGIGSNQLRAKPLTKRNFERQGKASAKPEGIDNYVEGDKSMGF